MTAFNAVRFRVKPGRDQDFLDAHKNIHRDWPGLKHAYIIKTGDHTYCIIAEWIDVDAFARARPNLISTLNAFRDTLAWRHRPGLRSSRHGAQVGPHGARREQMCGRVAQHQGPVEYGS